MQRLHDQRVRDWSRFWPQPSQILTRGTRNTGDQSLHIEPLSSDGLCQNARFRCLFQSQRPPHASGRPDPLPFVDASETEHILDTLDLPSSYVDLADGLVSTTYAHEKRGNSDASKLEFLAYCLSLQGDWSMALSYDKDAKTTSCFLSIDQCMMSSVFMDHMFKLQDFTCHPMLLPCILFSMSCDLAIKRRQYVKTRLSALESEVQQTQEDNVDPDHSLHNAGDGDREATRIKHLHQLLNSCRRDQASRLGRYDFWRSHRDALEVGFTYIDGVLKDEPDVELAIAQRELQQWSNLIWRKLESLMARDLDHITRITNVQNTLESIVLQRDMRLQSRIAESTQRDSEDMRFVALLGAVFLPASLIATILDVSEFDFLGGGKLFGAYVAIVVPLTLLVVVLCIMKPQRRMRRQCVGSASEFADFLSPRGKP